MIAMDKSTAIGAVMTTDVIAIAPDETMDQVRDIFQSNHIHHLPVVEEGKVVGIISYSDYLKLLHGFTIFNTEKSEAYNAAILRSLLVSEVMTRQVATLHPEDSVMVAAGIFRENLFHALPVIDQHSQLIGIVTTFDLLNFAFNDWLSLK